MDIVTLSVGPLQENTYLIADSKTASAVVVDPGDEAERILDEAKQRGWTIERIALTHGHADHIGAAAAIHRATGAPVAASPGDAPMLVDALLSGAVWLGLQFDPVSLNEPLTEDRPWTALGREWTVLDTPGHTPGHISLHLPAEGLLFCGDVLFAGSVGRTDLPGGSWDALANSLRTKIFTLPDNTRVYPGHGPATTIGAERRGNPFVAQILDDAPGGSNAFGPFVSPDSDR